MSEIARPGMRRLRLLKYIAEGRLTQEHIPDAPSVESERRQIFFGAAIGVPTFFVRQDTGNAFLKSILAKCDRIRHSRRYSGYLRIHHVGVITTWSGTDASRGNSCVAANRHLHPLVLEVLNTD